MKLKGIRQRDTSDCGAACLAYVAAWFGAHVSVSRVRQWAVTDVYGTSVYGLIVAAKKIGLNAEAVKCVPDVLPEMKAPLIAHVVRNGLTHFVVIVEISGDKIRLMDPSDGDYSSISSEKFNNEWTGVLLMISAGTNLYKCRKETVAGRLYLIIRPHKNRLAIAVLCAVVFTSISLALTAYLQQVVDKVVDQRDTSLLFILSLSVFTLIVIQSVAGVVRGKILLQTSQSTDRSLVMSYVRHVLHLPKTFHDTMRTGEILSRVNDAMRINMFINDVLISFVIDSMTILLSAVLMLIYNWKLALMVLMILPFYAIIYAWNDRVNKRWQKQVLKAGAEVDGVLVQIIQSVSTLKQLGLERYACDKTSSILENLLYATKQSGQKQLMIISATDSITRFFVVCIIWVATYFILEGDLTKGELLSFFAMISFFTTPAVSLMSAGKHLRETSIAVDRLFEILELDVENSVTSAGNLEGRAVNIEFRNVCFRYGNGPFVLRNISITVTNNSITGIKGSSGSGKSTLAALLLKLYEPSCGDILINGVNLNTLNHTEVRRLVAIVPQHTQLLNATIRENICLDRKDVNETHFNEIIDRTGVSEICESLPLGIDTVLVEQGYNLSGGQRQKISLARALLRNAPVLVLDEPTASLDAHSEEKIMQTIDWYKKNGNTVIIISHSDTALKICDNIVILKN